MPTDSSISLNVTPAAVPAVQDKKAAKGHGSKFTASKRLYRFPSRGGKRVKKHVESVLRFRGIDRLKPEMSSAVAYFLSGAETVQTES